MSEQTQKTPEAWWCITESGWLRFSTGVRLRLSDVCSYQNDGESVIIVQPDLKMTFYAHNYFDPKGANSCTEWRAMVKELTDALDVYFNPNERKAGT